MTFLKSDLKTGMKVVNRGGDEFIVFLDCVHGYNNNRHKDILVSKNLTKWSSLSNYSEFLICNCGLDIMSVYVPTHPYSITGIYDEWDLLWEREEKTEKQLKIEELEEKIEELKDTINKAQEQIEELKV